MFNRTHRARLVAGAFSFISSLVAVACSEASGVAEPDAAVDSGVGADAAASDASPPSSDAGTNADANVGHLDASPADAGPVDGSSPNDSAVGDAGGQNVSATVSFTGSVYYNAQPGPGPVNMKMGLGGASLTAKNNGTTASGAVSISGGSLLDAKSNVVTTFTLAAPATIATIAPGASQSVSLGSSATLASLKGGVCGSTLSFNVTGASSPTIATKATVECLD